MDIWLIDTNEGTEIRPKSIQGMLWLQTHFEDVHWEAIASNKVRLSFGDSKTLSEDAKSAGLRVNNLPSLSMTRKF